MYSKHGKDIHLPSWFIEGLPSIPLDGELSLGRGTFEQMATLLNSKTSDWSNVKYYLFDSPIEAIEYELRMEQLRNILLPPHVVFIPMERCKDQHHLEKLLDGILAAGGEGLMAREPKSIHSFGRSKSILKVKVQISCRRMLIVKEIP